jgi:hypothetical protein
MQMPLINSSPLVSGGDERGGSVGSERDTNFFRAGVQDSPSFGKKTKKCGCIPWGEDSATLAATAVHFRHEVGPCGCQRMTSSHTLDVDLARVTFAHIVKSAGSCSRLVIVSLLFCATELMFVLLFEYNRYHYYEYDAANVDLAFVIGLPILYAIWIALWCFRRPAVAEFGAKHIDVGKTVVEFQATDHDSILHTFLDNAYNHGNRDAEAGRVRASTHSSWRHSTCCGCEEDTLSLGPKHVEIKRVAGMSCSKQTSTFAIMSTNIKWVHFGTHGYCCCAKQGMELAFRNAPRSWGVALPQGNACEDAQVGD